MNKIKAFTLMEVMVSIFVFSSSMLGFMAFHAHSMAVLFENESAQTAHSLAFNLVDEVNAMAYESFHSLVSKTDWIDDSEVASLFGSNFKPSPFNTFGKKVETNSTDNYKFYRAIKVEPYSSQTNVYVQSGTYLSTLYHVEIRVAWPKREEAGEDCSEKGHFSEAKCNFVSIPLVRSDEQY